MPYIDKILRTKLQKATLADIAENVNDPGILNYVISYIITSCFKAQKRYATANMLLGVLEGVKAEFIRTQLGPYEQEKLEQNGEI